MAEGVDNVRTIGTKLVDKHNTVVKFNVQLIRTADLRDVMKWKNEISEEVHIILDFARIENQEKVLEILSNLDRNVPNAHYLIANYVSYFSVAFIVQLHCKAYDIARVRG